MSPMKRLVTVSLSEFSVSALASEGRLATADVPTRLVRAIRLYLSDHDAGRPGWDLPPQSGDEGDARGETVEFELSVEEDLWAQFEEEAGRQGVSVCQLAGHASLYYAAEWDAGRVTQRILDSLEEEDPEAEAS